MNQICLFVCVIFAALFGVFDNLATIEAAETFHATDNTNCTRAELGEFGSYQVKFKEIRRHFKNEKTDKTFLASKFNALCVVNVSESKQLFQAIDDTDGIKVYFTFIRDAAKSYRLSDISFFVNDSMTTVANLPNPDLKLTENKFKAGKQGYKCENIQFDLMATTDSTVSANNTEYKFEIIDFEFIAFRNGTQKEVMFECRQTADSSAIPLAVGGALLAFMVVSLVVYIFFRNRSK